jgi:hypothetical protein
MADLPIYKNLNEKKTFFSNGEKPSFIINTKSELDKWFVDLEQDEKQESEIDATAWIYRGTTEAKYKLLTSSQRLWINDEMKQWASKSYIDFISDLVKNAGDNTIIKKVFDLYNYSAHEREFPILSLLQHYGAPTPLMDWTYNNNVAFYFATDGLKKKEQPKDDIDNYFSIYRINKRKYKRELLNVIDFTNDLPDIKTFKELGDERGNKKSNNIFYISDFERKGESTGDKKAFSKLMIRTVKPLTSVYNQNIIPQEGLFIFNPFSEKTLEEIFNPDLNKSGWNLALTPFDCFNVHKDLAEYLKRKIDKRHKINKSFIYPNLNDEAKKIKEKTLNDLI